MEEITSQESMLDCTMRNMYRIAEKCRLSDQIIDRLQNPRETIEMTINPLLSNGKTATVKLFVVIHNRALGPAKGGIRFAASTSVQEVTALATEMTWKTSLIGVPFGGGKSGICLAGYDLTPQDKEILIRHFARAALPHIGPERYVPAPDMGTNETDMGYIRDTIASSSGSSITRGCFVTGKPVLLGGIPGRREATGQGVVFSTIKAANHLGIEVRGARVVVQGFGNVGSVVCDLLAQAGARIVAVSDCYGGCHNEMGLDISSLKRHVAEGGPLASFYGGHPIDGDELLSLECDILIPAATANQITSSNADQVRAKLIAEAANGPTTPEADEILDDNGVFVVPDILCNAGGVFVSYLEYTQETQREQKTIEEVNSRLKRRIEGCFDEVLHQASGAGENMRTAALGLAVKRVAQAIEARGLLP